MYFLLKMGIFQPAMLVYQRAVAIFCRSSFFWVGPMIMKLESVIKIFVMFKDLRMLHGFELFHWPTLIELRNAILHTKTTEPVKNTETAVGIHPGPTRALIIPKTEGSQSTQFTNWSPKSGRISEGAVPAEIFWPVKFIYTSPWHRFWEISI